MGCGVVERHLEMAQPTTKKFLSSPFACLFNDVLRTPIFFAMTRLPFTPLGIHFRLFYFHFYFPPSDNVFFRCSTKVQKFYFSMLLCYPNCLLYFQFDQMYFFPYVYLILSSYYVFFYVSISLSICSFSLLILSLSLYLLTCYSFLYSFLFRLYYSLAPLSPSLFLSPMGPSSRLQQEEEECCCCMQN